MFDFDMELTIQAKARSLFGKQNKKLRRQGTLPAVLYGQKKASLPLEISARAFQKVYRVAGENTLVNLMIEGAEEKKVLIHDVAKHFMKDEPIHVDFYEVDLTRKIHAKIPLHFVGVSPAVKELGGILLKNFNELEIEALPTDLPPFIEVNIEKLGTFEDLVRVSDLILSDKIRVLNNPEDAVASVQPPRSEQELAELEKPMAEAEKAAVEELAREEAVPREGEAGEVKAEAKEESKEKAPQKE